MESAGNGRPAGVSCGEGLDDSACDCCCWERKARCGRVHIKDERGRRGWGVRIYQIGAAPRVFRGKDGGISVEVVISLLLPKRENKGRRQSFGQIGRAHV